MTATCVLGEGPEILGRWPSARPARWRRLPREMPALVLPAALIAIAVLASAALGWGTRPGLARYASGVETIVFVRRVQWLLVGVALVSCMTLLTLVIANRRPVGWLFGLAPVLVLFTMRFGPSRPLHAVEIDATQFAPAAHPGAPRGDEWVVGVVFEGNAYALPYRALHATPLVALTDYSKRMLLMWSPGANRALAVTVTRELRPRALEIVSSPADGLIVLDRRYGQYISAITGRTIGRGGDPIGFASPVTVTKTTWAAWRAAHPTSGVMLARAASPAAHAVPARPRSELPARATTDAPANLEVAVIATQPPLAVPTHLVGIHPVNLAGGDVRLVLVRDPLTGTIRAFERRVCEDLFPTFSPATGEHRHPRAAMIDSDTRSLWTLDGRALSGPLEGEQLKSIPAEDRLYWGVMKFWYPELQLVR